MRRGLAAFAVLYLAAHLAFLPATLEDLDSVNFALGVRDFDVAQHQPHPPGYPLFIALGKIATSALRTLGVSAPEVRGLAIWSALSGALIVLLTFSFVQRVDGDRTRALTTTVLSATSPLMWFTASRPLSDMSGLAAVLAALGFMAGAIRRDPEEDAASSARALVAGACIAGLAAGLRSQTVVLTGPMLAVALALSRGRLSARVSLAAIGAFVAGVVLWGVPLMVASGGPAGYLAALGSQAGEDFSGVVMLWTNPNVRVAVTALLNTFVLPWDSPLLAGVVLALAAGGLLVLLRQALRPLALLFVAFGPYAAFHLLFQETATVRYALPLVVPVAYLAAVMLSQARRIPCVVATAGVAAFGLVLAAPAAVAFGRTPSPIVGLLARTTAGNPVPVVATHRRVFTESRRARQWTGLPTGRLLPAPRDYEWLEVTSILRSGSPLWFIADPRRTDLALIDPRGRTTESFRWPFNKATYVGGARPDEVDLHVYEHPGWMLEHGWALNPEVAGISQREGWVLQKQPSVGWIRRRPGEVVLMLGGRHLGGASDPPVRLEAAIDDRPVATLVVSPGFFLDFLVLPAGTLDGAAGFARLTVRADATSPGVTPPVALEQFNLQPPDIFQLGFAEGWQEPEYNPRTARSWRWMSEKAVLRVRPTNRDAVLRLEGESPLRYYSEAAVLSVSTGGRKLTDLVLDDDFVIEVPIPAQSLTASDGRITLESNQMFIPGEREGTADRRHLALRIYSAEIR